MSNAQSRARVFIAFCLSREVVSSSTGAGFVSSSPTTATWNPRLRLQSLSKAADVFFLQNVLQGSCRAFERFFQGAYKAFTGRLQLGFPSRYNVCLYKCSYSVFLKVVARFFKCFVQGVCKVSAMCFARCLHCLLQVVYKALTGCLQRSHKVFTMLLQGFRNAFTVFLQGV